MVNAGSHPEAMVPPVEGVAGGGTAYGWSESGIQDPYLLRGSIDPLKVHSSNLVHAWCMPSTANVGPQDMPRTLEPVSWGILYLLVLRVNFVVLLLYCLLLFPLVS